MSSDERTLPEELASLEAALGSLVPAASRLDRDALLFAAGQAAALGPLPSGGQRPARAGFARAWSQVAAVAALALLAVSFGRLWWSEREQRLALAHEKATLLAAQAAPLEQLVPPSEEPAPALAASAEDSETLAATPRPDYLKLRTALLRAGANNFAWPTPAGMAHEPWRPGDYPQLFDQGT